MRLSKQVLPWVCKVICKESALVDSSRTLLHTIWFTAAHRVKCSVLTKLNIRTSKRSYGFKFLVFPVFCSYKLAKETKLPKIWENWQNYFITIIFYYQIYLIYFKYVIVIKTLLHVIKSQPLLT